MEEINLDNPIFAFYLNVEGMSQQRTAQHLAELKREVTYTNITSWILPSNETKVDCVYPGKSMYNTPELENLIKEINERIDLLADSESFEDFKINVRDWRIGKLFNETNK
jgi:hypothetical protein